MSDLDAYGLPVGEPAGFQLVENCRYGRFLIPPRDRYVGEALRRYGEYSQGELELLLQFLLPDTRVVVAGANIGALVVPLARRCGEVLAFEPQRWVFQLLTANVVLNDLQNVRTIWGGLGTRGGEVDVPYLDPFVENNFGALELPAVQNLRDVPEAQRPRIDLVPIFTLDGFPGAACGLLTIDVEGMELDVLQGANALIKRCRPTIFFEADREFKRRPVFRFLRERDYELYWFKTTLFNPANWRGEKDNVFTRDGIPVAAENVLAVPKEAGHNLHGFTPVLEV